MSVPKVEHLVHRQNRRVLELFPDTARIDGGTLAIGGPTLLDAAEMQRILAAFAGYGQR